MFGIQPIESKELPRPVFYQDFELSTDSLSSSESILSNKTLASDIFSDYDFDWIVNSKKNKVKSGSLRI